MENKEYVLEKLAINYASTPGRILARLGNKRAKYVISNFKDLHDIALAKGLTTKNLGGFMKDMERDPNVAKKFIQENTEAIEAAEKVKAGPNNENKEWSILKPWTKKQKVVAGIAAGVGIGGGALYYGSRKQPSEEEYYQTEQLPQ